MMPAHRAVLRLAVALLVLLGLPSSTGAARAAAVFTVISNADTADANIGDGVCADAQGRCTLRAAIQEANADAGADTIGFAIPSFAAATIKPSTPLPTISDAVTIDGTTEPYGWIQLNGANAGAASGFVLAAASITVEGFLVNRFQQDGFLVQPPGSDVIEGNVVGTNLEEEEGIGNGTGVEVDAPGNVIGGISPGSANIIVDSTGASGVHIQGTTATGNVLEGNLIGTDGVQALPNLHSGVLVDAPGTTIGGTTGDARNVISGNSDSGVLVDQLSTLIEGNYIGTDASGTKAVPNDDDGILVLSAGTTIGGTVSGAGNVISGNSDFGVLVDLSSALVEGNFIGTDASGTKALGNGVGIFVEFGNNTVVGGTTAGAGNVISGNGWGVGLAAANDTVIQGNHIGTDASGTLPLGNSSYGLNVQSSSGDTIGGTQAGAANVIAYSGADGVTIYIGSTGDAIRGNSIYANGTTLLDLGIDLIGQTGGDGVTPNDPGDGDIGGNNLQNFPDLGSATSKGATTTVAGSLSSTASTSYTLDFYATNPCDVTGHGEGQRYLGSTQVTTDGSGNATFSASMPSTVASHQFVTATATDPNGNTSEFSSCVRVTRIGPDFNGDGAADLVSGVPGEDVGSPTPVVDAGAVNVIYGSASGLKSTNNQFWTQDTGTVQDSAETADAFGSALGWGDFNGDGYDDLAVGVPSEDVGTKSDAGAVNALYGSSGGLADTGNQLWTQDTSGVLDKSESKDRFGAALTSGDFNGDGYADLAVGAPGEKLGTAAGAGAVNVLFGSSAGLTAAGNQFWTQNAIGGTDASEPGDQFGAALTASDFDGDGYSDLAAGAPLEDFGAAIDTGQVDVLPGSQSGPSADRYVLIVEAIIGLGGAETGDQFGSALAAADFDGDGYSDLAAGAPLRDVGTATDAGQVGVVYGSSGGLDTNRAETWNQDSTGIADTAEINDHLGAALAATDFNGDDDADLAVGVPGEDVGTVVDAGGVAVIYGISSGLSSANNQFWTQDTGIVKDSAEAGDQFGASLTAADFKSSDRWADLAIGVPTEDLGVPAIVDAGAVAVLYGTGDFLADTGNQLWHQDATGVLDQNEAGDRFGNALP